MENEMKKQKVQACVEERKRPPRAKKGEESKKDAGHSRVDAYAGR